MLKNVLHRSFFEHVCLKLLENNFIWKVVVYVKLQKHNIKNVAKQMPHFRRQKHINNFLNFLQGKFQIDVLIDNY